MSDRDTAPDPVDTAYNRAEALLDDAAARAARRERVLGAVGGEAAAAPRKLTASPQPRRPWHAARWLTAASVAGLATFVALRLEPETNVGRPASTADSHSASIKRPSTIEASPEAAQQTPSPAPAPVAVAPSIVETQARASNEVLAEAAPNSSAAAAAPPPSSAPAAVSADAAATSEVIATGGRAAPAPATPRARSSPSAAVVGATAATPDASAAKLRAAAAAGRIAELTTLLDQGAPIDEPDAAGETALMKSIRANQPATAALLRRRGADLDRRNNAGVSARELAAAIGDREFNRALEITP